MQLIVEWIVGVRGMSASSLRGYLSQTNCWHLVVDNWLWSLLVRFLQGSIQARFWFCKANFNAGTDYLVSKLCGFAILAGLNYQKIWGSQFQQRRVLIQCRLNLRSIVSQMRFMCRRKDGPLGFERRWPLRRLRRRRRVFRLRRSTRHRRRAGRLRALPRPRQPRVQRYAAVS